MTDPITNAFARALSAIDDAMQLVRELQEQRANWRVDTLSSSLADPRGHQIEQTLSSARNIIAGDEDRMALITVARACRVQGLISHEGLGRLLQDFDRA